MVFQNNISRLSRIPTGGRLSSWLIKEQGRGVEPGTTENRSRKPQGGGFEPVPMESKDCRSLMMRSVGISCFRIKDQ